jgi:murein L,D-transpeptidase YafK
MKLIELCRPRAFKYGLGALSLCVVAVGTSASTPDLVTSSDPTLLSKQPPAESSAAPGVATPADRERRLAEKSLTPGSPVLIRIFKAEAELELWMEKDGRFERFATYPICFWSGTLGPKLKEGDRQAPEGFYAIRSEQVHRKGRWKDAFDIGYPNIVDRANGRTGSAILIHGGCQSIGCYAMTNSVMAEIFALSEQALFQGQSQIPVHVFPFRMTDENLAAYASHPWHRFWTNLKEAHDLFDRTHIQPAVAMCGRRYLIGDGSLPGNAAALDALVSDERECEVDEPQPTLQEIAEARKLTPKATRAQVIAAVPVASRKVSSRRIVGRNVRQNYAAARKARMATFAKRTAYSGRVRAH